METLAPRPHVRGCHANGHPYTVVFSNENVCLRDAWTLSPARSVIVLAFIFGVVRYAGKWVSLRMVPLMLAICMMTMWGCVPAIHAAGPRLALSFWSNPLVGAFSALTLFFLTLAPLGYGGARAVGRHAI